MRQEGAVRLSLRGRMAEPMRGNAVFPQRRRGAEGRLRRKKAEDKGGAGGGGTAESARENG